MRTGISFEERKERPALPYVSLRGRRQGLCSAGQSWGCKELGDSQRRLAFPAERSVMLCGGMSPRFANTICSGN